MAQSHGAVTHVAQSHGAVTWRSHMAQSHGAVTWHSHTCGAVTWRSHTRGAVTWCSHMVQSHGAVTWHSHTRGTVTWRSHMAQSHGAVTCCSHMVQSQSRGEVTWRSHTEPSVSCLISLPSQRSNPSLEVNVTHPHGNRRSSVRRGCSVSGPFSWSRIQELQSHSLYNSLQSELHSLEHIYCDTLQHSSPQILIQWHLSMRQSKMFHSVCDSSAAPHHQYQNLTLRYLSLHLCLNSRLCQVSHRLRLRPSNHTRFSQWRASQAAIRASTSLSMCIRSLRLRSSNFNWGSFPALTASLRLSTSSWFNWVLARDSISKQGNPGWSGSFSSFKSPVTAMLLRINCFLLISTAVKLSISQFVRSVGWFILVRSSHKSLHNDLVLDICSTKISKQSFTIFGESLLAAVRYLLIKFATWSDKEQANLSTSLCCSTESRLGNLCPKSDWNWKITSEWTI